MRVRRPSFVPTKDSPGPGDSHCIALARFEAVRAHLRHELVLRVARALVVVVVVARAGQDDFDFVSGPSGAVEGELLDARVLVAIAAAHGDMLQADDELVQPELTPGGRIRAAEW
jgi:hypothetical protein